MNSMICAIVGMLVGICADLVSTELKCPERNGMFLHPGSFNCESFVKCTNGVPQVVHCGEGRQFHIEKGACVTQSAVLCDLQWVRILDPSARQRKTERSNLQEDSSLTRDTGSNTFHTPWGFENDFTNQRHKEKSLNGRKSERLRAKEQSNGDIDEFSDNASAFWDTDDIESLQAVEENSLGHMDDWIDYDDSSVWYDPSELSDQQAENNVLHSEWEASSYIPTWQPDNTLEHYNDIEPYNDVSEWESTDDDYYTDEISHDDMTSFVSSLDNSVPYTSLSTTYRSLSDTRPKKPKNDMNTKIYTHSEVYKFNASSEPFKEGNSDVNGVAVKIVNDQNSTYSQVNNVTKVATTKANNKTTSFYEVPSRNSDVALDKKKAQTPGPKIRPYITNTEKVRTVKQPTTKPHNHSSENKADASSQTFLALSNKYRPVKQERFNNPKKIGAGATCAVIKPYACPRRDGVFLLPNSHCEKFALCKNGVPDIYMCEPGLKFDLSQKKCREAETVICSDEANHLRTRRMRRAASPYADEEEEEVYETLPQSEPYSADISTFTYDYYIPDTNVFAPAPAPAAPAAPKTVKVYQKSETIGHYKVNQDANTHNDSNIETVVTLSKPSGHGSELARKTTHHEIDEENIKYEHDRDYEHVDIIPVKKAVPLLPAIDAILARRPPRIAAPLRTAGSAGPAGPSARGMPASPAASAIRRPPNPGSNIFPRIGGAS